MRVERDIKVNLAGFIKSLGEITIREAAKATEGKAVVLAPVDTGNLRSSMYSRVQTSDRAEVGNTSEYAIYQEFGTRHMSAQPYLIPALDETKSQLDRIARDAAREAYARNQR